MRFSDWRALLTTVAAMTTLATASGAQETAPFDQAAAIADLKKFIAGREETPAVDVFNNIQKYTSLSAGRLLGMMESGFTVALGVNCVHCHKPDVWDSDEKPAKQVARDMAAMLDAINNDYLKKIANLRSTNPQVNCITCHRGQRRPALEMSPAPKPPG